MRLRVSGYEARVARYRFLWGFRVTGYRPWEHCQKCFRGGRVEAIRPAMTDGVYPIEGRMDYFYLHGNAAGPASLRGARNLHLAVRPQVGTLASVTDGDRAVFTVEDAEAIVIQPPIHALSHLPRYWRCPNVRFGLQMYPVPLDQVGPDAPRL